MQFAALHSFSALTQRSLEMNFFLFIFESLQIIFSTNYFHKCSTIKFDSSADFIVKCLRGRVHGGGGKKTNSLLELIQLS